jgi:excisionase family DNA binding protein
MRTHETSLNRKSQTPALLTVDEAAAALRVSRSTVWRLADAGHLSRVRIGPAERLVRFSAQDVEALIHAGSEDKAPRK